MPSGKDRLLIALYARGGSAKMPGLEDTYHWALIVGPKDERRPGEMGTRFHAKEKVAVTGVPPRPHTVWTYEEKAITLRPTAMLLVRIVIAKVLDNKRLQAILQGIPIRSDTRDWNCVGWVQEAWEALVQDGRALGTSAKSWAAVRDTAMSYVARKKAAHRFDGQGDYDYTRAATWDMLDGKELVP
ncbi:hypothetical protein EKO27_g8374 [Xylaria grammica]|uniref:Uncharacterized protein n=1 Tax=Xylaria grammica TaxID=363999 RepID=A0A439CX70_9PEZI|nr:hypothetical protein EKO27_g8374 [Xylaria grammica]